MSASSRGEQKAATRRAVLDAAVDVFASHGFDGGNFRQITEQCGVQRNLILYHFDSKEVLWQAAVVEIERRLSEAFLVRFDRSRCGDDRALARHALGCFLDAMIEVPQYGMVFLKEGVSEGPRMQWLSRTLMPALARVVVFDDPALQERVNRTVLRDILASLLVSFVTLGPMLEAALAGTLRKPAGVYPLSDSRKAELIEAMLLLMFPDEEAGRAD